MVRIKIVYIQNNTVWVNADRGRDFHPLTDRMTKLRNFTKEENRVFFSNSEVVAHAESESCLMAIVWKVAEL